MRSTTPANRRGFSLVEVLAALSVLSILMLLLGRLFTDSSSAYRTGVGRMDMDGGARAGLEFMARELQAAQVNDLVTMRVETGITALGRATDRISFLSLYNTPEYRNSNPYREGMQVRYSVLATTANPNRFFVGRHVVERENSGDYTAYTNTTWYTVFNGYQTSWANSLVENVCGFRVLVTDRTGVVRTNYDSTTHPPPLWVDLYLEVLSPEDAARVELLTGAAREDYIQQKCRRYTQRVLLQNRQHPLTW